MELELSVLIIEDGNEYLENLSRFVTGPRYRQAHSAREALAILAAEPVDLIYLDMRFDRTPAADLAGDFERVLAEHNVDEAAARRHLATHQGLYILHELRRAGHGDVPVLLAYDFSREGPRFETLRRAHPTLRWVPDAVTPDEIRRLMAASANM